MKTLFFVAVVAASALSGCATSQQIQGPNGEPLMMIECGSAVSMGVCYSKAKEVCPNGYRSVSEESGFDRKTLKVSCQ